MRERERDESGNLRYSAVQYLEYQHLYIDTPYIVWMYKTEYLT